MRLLALLLALVLAAPVAASDSDAEARVRMKAAMEGTWTGMFRRYGPDGVLTEALPSVIHVRFAPEAGPQAYHQTNVLTYPNGREQRLETKGHGTGGCCAIRARASTAGSRRSMATRPGATSSSS
jgi:hypothetical protein